MKIRDILQAKGSQVHSISPTATLDQVVQALVAHNCGSLMVMDGPKMCGIITERDILRTVAGETRELNAIQVTSRMSQDLVTSAPEEELSDVMSKLTQNRVRHLPVVENGDLVGIISIGDVVKSQQKSLATENEFLRNYMNGTY